MPLRTTAAYRIVACSVARIFANGATTLSLLLPFSEQAKLVAAAITPTRARVGCCCAAGWWECWSLGFCAVGSAAAAAAVAVAVDSQSRKWRRSFFVHLAHCSAALSRFRIFRQQTGCHPLIFWVGILLHRRLSSSATFPESSLSGNAAYGGLENHNSRRPEIETSD